MKKRLGYGGAMNKYSLLTTVLLTSSVLFTDTTQAMNKHLLKDDAEVQILKKVGRPQFIQEKSKLAAERKRLSNKGDLANDQDATPRRRFYTIGDGDCFFWGTDFTRAQAQALWLQNSGQPHIRYLARAEIFDEFMDNQLPEVMYQLPALTDARQRLDNFNALLRELNPAEHATRRDINEHKTTLEQEIKDVVCAREDVYRSYVQNALATNENYMLSPQDFGGNYRTYFIDALAYLRGRRLTIWNLNEQGTLVTSHTYDPGNAYDTWELLLDEEHYTRIVPTDNLAGLEHAAARENLYINQRIQKANQKTKGNITNLVELLNLDKVQRMAHSPLFSQSEQTRFSKNAAALQQRVKEVKPLDENTRAAFYKIMMDGALDQIDKKMAKALRNAEQRSVLEQEIELLREDVLFCREVLQQLKTQPTDMDVADVLLQLYYYYAELADKQEAKSEDSKLPQAEREEAKIAFQGFAAQKALYRDAFEALEKTLTGIDSEVALKAKEAKKRRDANLKKNLKLQNTWSFTADYNAAKKVVDAHFKPLKAAKKKHFNPDYLSADPFSTSVLPDLPKEDITDDMWRNDIPERMKRAILKCLFSDNDNESFAISGAPYQLRNCEVFGVRTSEYPYSKQVPFLSEAEFKRRTNGAFPSRASLIELYEELGTIFGRLEIYDVGDSMPEQKRMGRKRFMRLIDYKIAQSKSENEGKNCDADLVEAIGRVNGAMTLQQIGGCPDGVMGSLDILEAQMVGDRKSLELDVSALLADYVHEFVHKYARLSPGDVEWCRNAPQFAKQRTMLSLPHQGEARSNFYVLTGSVSAEAKTTFAPANLMRTFLEGKDIKRDTYVWQNGQYKSKTITVKFHPFTADTFINLVWGAYKRGLKHVKVGKTITQQNILDFINKDPWLNFLHDNYALDGEYCEFFGANDKDGYIKKPFFEYMLIRLGYIINVGNKWEPARQKFIKEQASNGPNKLVDLGVLDSSGKPKTQGKFQLCRSSLKKNATIEGWATPIEIDFSKGTLTCSGWSARSGQGATPFVSIVYNGAHVGTVPVDQDSPDITQHYSDQSIAGDYSKARFQTTLRLRDIDFRGFNPNLIKIIGVDGQEGYNELSQTPVTVKGMLCKNGALTINGKLAVKVAKLQGAATSIKWNAVTQTLSAEGWSAIEGKGPATKVAVFYRGTRLGEIPVNQNSPDIVKQYAAQAKKTGRAIPGNYAKARFKGTLNLAGFGLQTLNPKDIEVVGLDKQNGFNVLSKKVVECKGSITSNSEQQILKDGQALVRKQALVGWAVPIEVDSKRRRLSVSGWSALEGTGAVPSVCVLYKGKNLGIIAVNKPSPDVSEHFNGESQRRGQVIAGDYSNCRFEGTLDLSNIDLTDFREDQLEVLGIDSSNGYNLLGKLPVTFK